MDPDIKQRWEDMRIALGRLALTQAVLAERAGVSQAAVSRLLERPPNSNGRAFKRLCVYAHSKHNERRPMLSSSREGAALVAALEEVWNGTPEHAQALAAMIRAAGVAARIAMG